MGPGGSLLGEREARVCALCILCSQGGGIRGGDVCGVYGPRGGGGGYFPHPPHCSGTDSFSRILKDGKVDC